MFARDVHVFLALAALGIVAVSAIEGASRIFTRRPAGRIAAAMPAVSMIIVGMTAAGGLSLLVRGEGPKEVLHYVYAVLAFLLIPFGDTLTAHHAPRRRAVARLVTALAALGVVARLFATG